MVFNVCVKFHDYISNGFDEQSRHDHVLKIAIFQCSKGNNSKRMQSGVMVSALCTSSHPPYHLCEVL